MFIIAHRGASKQKKENTMEAFSYACEHGANAVETDVRRTADGVFVLYHDDKVRLNAQEQKPVRELSFADLRKAVLHRGTHGLMTLRELTAQYHYDVPVLFHIKLQEGEESAFIEQLENLKAPCFFGPTLESAARIFSARFGRERVLAFMPKKDMEDAFLAAGAGIIRLWEHWLLPGDVQRIHSKGARVWVMMKNEHGVGETDIEHLLRVSQTGADGLLLNDIHITRQFFDRY
ncbi:MAG: glycerophosphodiester phosphodiesterase [Oscillospiraceae bacterium]|jgi:glycerophosphoryl diester phosphodiesterase|nr:glycerophosphodiester phosphodiesterase [Oscillospiraceae bacterium]